MAHGICDKRQTILSFADVRAACRLSPAQIGLGNVESTPIGFVQNGQTVVGGLPNLPHRDRCAAVYRKPACAPC